MWTEPDARTASSMVRDSSPVRASGFSQATALEKVAKEAAEDAMFEAIHMPPRKVARIAV